MIKRLISAFITATMVIALIPVTAGASVDIYGTPPGWGQSWWNLTPDELLSVSLDDTIYHDGDRSLKLNGWGYRVPDHYLKMGTTIITKPDTSYVYGCYVKADKASNCYVMLDWKNYNHFLTYESTFNWRRLENQYTTGANESSVPFYIINEACAGTVWLDSFYWYELDDDGNKIGENLFTYGDFDTGIKKSDTNKTNVPTASASGYDESLAVQYKNVTTSAEFAVSDMNSILGAMPVIRAKKADNITVDASTDDWNSYPVLKLPTTNEQYQIYNSNAQKDVTAEYKYAYDDKYFYFETVVEDPIHFSYADDNYWQGDSLQLGFSTQEETFGLEIGLSYNADTDVSFKTCGDLSPDQLNSIQYKAKRDGIKTTYEVAIPWTVKFTDGQPDSFLFTYVINNNDGNGRDYCLQVSKGITEGKFNSEFPRILLSDKDWYSWIKQDTPSTNTNGKISYTYTIINEGEARDFKVKFGEETYTVSVAANTGKNISYEYQCGDKYGDYKLNCGVSCGEESEMSSFTYTVLPTKDYFNNTFEEYDKWLKDLDSLISRCKNLGISTDYETVAYSILKEFYEYTKSDISAGKYVKAAHNVDSMRVMYSDAKENLEAYIKGTKTPLETSRYQTSKVEINGKQLYADVKTGNTVENRPVFFTGYGHWIGVSDIERSQKELGANISQFVIAPADVLMDANEGYGFKVNPNGLDGLKKKLDACEANNVSCVIMLEHHNFPQWLINKYTDMAVSESGGGFFVRYNISHPAAKAAIEAYVRAVTDLVKDYTCVQSIAIGNEDMYRTQYIPYYQPYYAQYLTELYKGDINLLNAQYGTDYKGFLDIEMPQTYSETPQFYDYRVFNTNIFNGWHQWIADMIHEVIPDAKFHVKWVMDVYTKEWSRSRSFFMINGMDPERFGDWADINGNDGGFFFDYLEDSFTPLSYLMGADIQVGAKTAPVVNTELHLLFDGLDSYSDKYQKLINAYTWQSAVHSIAGQVNWFLGLRDWNYCLFSDRPDCMYQLGKAGLDLNRNAWQVAALNNKQGDVCMLYSQTSRLYEASNINTTSIAYEAAVYSGRKVDFVEECSIDNLMNYKILILPNTKNVSSNALAKIKEFTERGGKVIMLGDECLARNEYNKPHNAEIVSQIKEKATVIPVTTSGSAQLTPDRNSIRAVIDDECAKCGQTYVELVDAHTGSKLDNIEYMTCEYNGKLLVNICDWSMELEDVKNVKIKINGSDYNGSIRELRSNEALPAAFEVKPFNPILVEIDK